MSKPFSKRSTKISPIVLALTLAFPLAATAATKPAKPTTEQLQSEIELLKAQLAELKKMVMEKAATPAPIIVQAPPPPPAKPSVDVAEFNRIRVKMEAMEDVKESSGFKDFKVSGFLDPTYIFNQRAHRGSVLFLDTQDGTPNDFTTNAFSYDNSNFGGATIKIEKELDGGAKAMMTLRPHKSGSTTIVEEALLTIPLDDGIKLIAGKQISWNGYEYVNAPDMKNITHNLLFDFGGPYYVVGGGLTFKFAGMDFKTLAGNLNTHRDVPGSKSRGLHWRGDVGLNEFSGWGASGMHGKVGGQNYNYGEVDFWYTKGDLTFNAQLEGSRHKASAYNGGDASHIGVSALAAYKLTPQWEAVVRGDWYNNSKNGGGGPAFVFGDCSVGTVPVTVNLDLDSSGVIGDILGELGIAVDADGDGIQDTVAAGGCGDNRSGFGPGMVDDGTGTNTWVLGDPNRGAKRTALTLGLNYTLSDNALLKFEYRYDRSDINSFFDFNANNYKKSNTVFGVQTVVKF